MTLITRLTTLFKADIHGIIDALEEPETLLKQAVRDMEEEIEKTKLSLKHLEKQIEKFAASRITQSDKLQETERQIDFAFSESNENLIKSLLRKKLETERMIESVENKCEQLTDDKKEMETLLMERNDNLKSITDKLNLFTSGQIKHPPNDIGENDSLNIGKTVTKEDVELAYLMEKKRRKENSIVKSLDGEKQ